MTSRVTRSNAGPHGVGDMLRGGASGFLSAAILRRSASMSDPSGVGVRGSNTLRKKKRANAPLKCRRMCCSVLLWTPDFPP
jgi:hypothetical protein